MQAKTAYTFSGIANNKRLQIERSPGIINFQQICKSILL